MVARIEVDSMRPSPLNRAHKMTNFKWKSASLIVAFTVLFVSGSACADPLFRQMIGTWQGKGTRAYPISGRQVEVDETVVTTVQSVNGQPAVVSTNQVTEISSTGTPYSYTTSYWVKAQ